MYKKILVFSSIGFLFLFLLDYIVTLFSIYESGTYFSFLGLKFEASFTAIDLTTVISFTPKILYSYLFFVLSFLFFSYVFKLLKYKKNKGIN